MISKRHHLGKFLILEISDDFTVISDLQELDIFIDGLIQHGHHFIALRFEKISYIYSGALSILLKNIRKLKERKGDICLLEPNREVSDLIRITNLHRTIRVFNSEDELIAYQENSFAESSSH